MNMTDINKVSVVTGTTLGDEVKAAEAFAAANPIPTRATDPGDGSGPKIVEDPTFNGS
jgi:hypothetical protein